MENFKKVKCDRKYRGPLKNISFSGVPGWAQ